MVNGLPAQAQMSGLGGSCERLPVMRKQLLDPVNDLTATANTRWVERDCEPCDRVVVDLQGIVCPWASRIAPLRGYAAHSCLGDHLKTGHT